jgi:hypothetical protein
VDAARTNDFPASACSCWRPPSRFAYDTIGHEDRKRNREVCAISRTIVLKANLRTYCGFTNRMLWMRFGRLSKLLTPLWNLIARLARPVACELADCTPKTSACSCQSTGARLIARSSVTLTHCRPEPHQ